MTFETTLRKLRECEACEDMIEHLTEALGGDYGDDTPVSVLKILEINGIDDAHCSFRACELGESEKKVLSLYLCDIAEHVLHVFEERYPGDTRPRDVVRAKRLWVDGDISNEELVAARDARDAGDAGVDVWSAGEAAWFAGEAAWNAGDFWAAGAAMDVAWAARDAAKVAEREWQEEKLRKLLEDAK